MHDSRCSVLFSSYRSTSFLINGVTEVLGPDTPEYRFVTGIQDPFHLPRSGERRRYPAVYRIWTVEAYNKTPGPKAGEKIALRMNPAYFARQFAMALLAIEVAVVLNFLLIHLMPGDPASRFYADPLVPAGGEAGDHRALRPGQAPLDPIPPLPPETSFGESSGFRSPPRGRCSR